jgi:hypothetical protein
VLNVRTVKAREFALESDPAFDKVDHRKDKPAPAAEPHDGTYRDPATPPAVVEGPSLYEKTWRAFVEGTGPLSAVPVRQGYTPSVFNIRRLTRKEYLYVSDLSGSARLNAAVAFGLTGWKDYIDAQPARVKTDVGERLTEDCLDAIFCPDVFGQLALAILGMSELGPSSEQA